MTWRRIASDIAEDFERLQVARVEVEVHRARRAHGHRARRAAGRRCMRLRLLGARRARVAPRQRSCACSSAARAGRRVVVEIARRPSRARISLQPIGEIVARLPPLPADLLDLAQFVAAITRSRSASCSRRCCRRSARRSRASRGAASGALMRLTDGGSCGAAASLERALAARRAARQCRAPDGMRPPTLAILGCARLGARSARGATRVTSRRDAGDAAASSDRVVLNADQRIARRRDRRGARHASRRSCCTASPAAARPRSTCARPRDASRAGGQALVLVPEINLTPQLEQRIADALPGRAHRRCCTAGSRPASGAAQLAAPRRAATRDLVLGHAARGVRAAAALGLDRRRRGARRVVQAAGGRALPRRATSRSGARGSAASRSCSAARRRRSRRCVQAQRGPLPAGCKLPQRADRARARLPRGAHSCDTRAAARIEGIGAPLRRGDRSAPRARRAVPALPQPPRLRAVAACARPAAGRRRARAAARGWSSTATTAGCAAITAASPSGCRARCPDCGNVDLLPLGRGTQRLERALAARFPGGAHRAHRPRQHAAQGRVRDDARARRRRRGRHPGRHADAGQGPRLPAPHAGRRARRRQRALQRRLPRDRAAVRAARAGRRPRRPRASCPAKCIVQTDFPAHPLYRGARRATTTRASPRRCSRSARCAGFRRSRTSRCCAAEAHAARAPSTRSSARRAARDRRSRRDGASRGRSVLPGARGAARAAPGWSARRCWSQSARSRRAAALPAALARGARSDCPGAACAGRSTSTRWDSLMRARTARARGASAL